ncbi:MAG: carbohydrate ABC transporter permease [Firmicutes bacterium]|nr:carbohydrate ABC transporter permease [Bacillota bacterium]
MIRESRSDKIFLIVLYIFFGFVTFFCFFPVYNCFVMSLNDGADAMKGGIYFWPRIFSLKNYGFVFSNDNILNAYVITVTRTVVGVVTSVLFNALFAYALTRRALKGRRVYVYLCMITMFFSGGMIPTYMTVRAFGLLDNFWVYILLPMSSFFTVLIFMAFFSEIPSSLPESAKIDGANELRIFWRIILPVSTPVLATIALFQGVYHWNSWYETYVYMSSGNYPTLPYLLMQMINQSVAQQLLIQKGLGSAFGGVQGSITANSIRLATMFATLIPIMLVYPFVQKYFIKGIMLGAVKE